MPETSRSNGAQPFRCQLALQGGGAKLVALMAAMEGVQRLHDEGRLKVTRVAGTSAGSIVAALFAAGVPLGQARSKLQSTLGPIAEQLVFPSRARMMWRLGVRGEPLWDEQLVASVLRPLFEEAKVERLGDIAQKTGIHVHIVASVLSDSRKHVHRDSQQPIVPALLDSCGIPFCFRTWQLSGPVIVDGGICENLPSDELLDYEKVDGPVLAVSFKSTIPGTQRTLTDFSMALLDTAINNSVSRSKTRLGAERVCEITTTIPTFDFGAAVRFSSDEAFRIRAQATEFFEGFIDQRRRSIPGDPWSTDASSAVMEDLWRIYKTQHSTREQIVDVSTSLVVQANCLADPNEAFYGEPDYLFFTITFRAWQEMFCTNIVLIPDQGSLALNSSELQFLDNNGDPVGFVAVPVRDPENVTRRPVLIHFTPPLAPGSGPYTLKLSQEVPDFMSDLRSRGWDDLFVLTKPSPEPVKHIELVAYVPKRLSSAAAAPFETSLGTKMSAAQLRDYNPPPGFRAVGWCGDDIKPGVRFACKILT